MNWGSANYISVISNMPFPATQYVGQEGDHVTLLQEDGNEGHGVLLASLGGGLLL